MKQLTKYFKGYERQTVLAPLFKLLEALMDLFVPIVVAWIIDTGIGTQNRTVVWQGFFLMLLLAVAGLGFSVTAQLFAAKASVGFATNLRQALFDHVENLSYTELDTLGTNTLITRMTSDINQVQSGLNMALRLLLRSPFIVFGSMIMAFTINVRAALVFVVAIPVLGAVVFTIMAVSIPLFRKVQAALDGLLGITRENLTGVRVIRAFCKEDDEIAEFDERNEALTKMNLFVGRLSALMNPATYFLINLATIVLIRVGAIQVNLGNLEQGQVVALYNYMAQMIVELIKLASLIITINKSLACAERVANVLEVKSGMEFPAGVAEKTKGQPESVGTSMDHAAADGSVIPRRNPKDPAETSSSAGSKTSAADLVKAEAALAHAKTAAGEEVAFHHVSFTYQGAGAEAVTDLDFQVKKGQTVGIIGGTGSGKSTLVNLIPRFYDATEGAVYVDGRNVKEYTEAAIRDKFGIVPQKAVLFEGTIRDNMKWGNENATDEEIMKAVRTAQAAEVVEGKKGGLDAEVEQNGRNFSGGQRQRLTIARALVREPEILIMDDSSSALDFATDAALRRAIRGLNDDRKDNPMTVFIVSQRTSSIMNADLILVLSDGEIVGKGTHEQLLQGCDVYQEIYYSQFPEKRPGDGNANMAKTGKTGKTTGSSVKHGAVQERSDDRSDKKERDAGTIRTRERQHGKEVQA